MCTEWLTVQNVVILLMKLNGTSNWDIWKEWICIFNFNFKKKNHQLTLNDYDIHLKSLLENEFHQATVKDLISYTEHIYFKLKSLPIYPDGIEKEDAQRRIDSLKQCLQYAIEEYDDWLNEVNNYIDENKDKFEFYSGYRTGEREYPPMSYEIIDDTVRFQCMRDGRW